MKIFTSLQRLFAINVFLHSSSQESFLVMYEMTALRPQAVSEYPANAVFISIRRLNHRVYTHVMIAPDGKAVVATSSNRLKEIR